MTAAVLILFGKISHGVNFRSSVKPSIRKDFLKSKWIPAFAGMTVKKVFICVYPHLSVAKVFEFLISLAKTPAMQPNIHAPCRPALD
jgi:hypothetical protein